MKKLLSIALIGILASFFTSCDKETEVLDTTNQDVEEIIASVEVLALNPITGESKVVTIEKEENESSIVELRGPVSANGHYNFFHPDYGESSITYTFSAVENNGGVHGSANVHGLFPGISDFKMTIDCILVEGNRATIGGIITEVTDDAGLSCIGCCGADYQFFAVGNNVLFAVEDNGEGQNGPRDKVAGNLLIGFPTCALTCDLFPPDSPWWEVYGEWPEVYLPSDQIQVKP